MTLLPDFEAWAIFAKVVERGSFSLAASDLGLAKATVSKAVSRLEERMQTTLLHRTTRKLSLTESGRISLERAMRIWEDGAAVESEVFEQAAAPKGLVSLAVPSWLGEVGLGSALLEFLRAYPDVEINCSFTENAVDVVTSGYDFVIRIGMGIDSSLRASRLFSLRSAVVASPEFRRAYGAPRHPSDLAQMPAIVATHIPNSTFWEFFNSEGQRCPVEVRGRLRVNHAAAIIAGLEAGFGMASLPVMFVSRQLSDGSLVQLLPDWNVAATSLYFVSPPGRVRPARVGVLMAFLRERFATMDWAGATKA